MRSSRACAGCRSSGPQLGEQRQPWRFDAGDGCTKAAVRSGRGSRPAPSNPNGVTRASSSVRSSPRAREKAEKRLADQAAHGRGQQIFSRGIGVAHDKALVERHHRVAKQIQAGERGHLAVEVASSRAALLRFSDGLRGCLCTAAALQHARVIAARRPSAPIPAPSGPAAPSPEALLGRAPFSRISALRSFALARSEADLPREAGPGVGGRRPLHRDLLCRDYIDLARGPGSHFLPSCRACRWCTAPPGRIDALCRFSVTWAWAGAANTPITHPSSATGGLS